MIASQFHSIGEGHEQDVSHFQQKETADEGKTAQYAWFFFWNENLCFLRELNTVSMLSLISDSDLNCQTVDLTLNKSESI